MRVSSCLGVDRGLKGCSDLGELARAFGRLGERYPTFVRQSI